MPKYVYQCKKCEQIYEIIHSFEETYDTCSQINEQSQCDISARLERIPQCINYLNLKKQEGNIRPGQLVDEYIEDTKQEVKKYKEEMINWSPKK
tara:strand:+ start:198 stop:479 length:282 start_codon:yes stop_codon:yes gene_type:complete